MKIEIHPFNDTYGRESITGETTKLILGTFPAFQVTNKGTVRLDFYYGSTDNKFWDLFKESLSAKFELTVESIRSYLSDNNFGIIDIVRKCYRKDNKSSADEDLSIIELQDIVDILANSSIDTIYTTSKFVTKLLKQQIEPLLDRNHPTEKGKGKKKKKKKEIFTPETFESVEFVKVELPGSVFNKGRSLSIKTLYSPSDLAIRGIAKRIKKGPGIDPLACRREQYRLLLT
ncbi:MAG: hypothetical protein QM731_03175 [Chitinophagaceae bacterium]